MELMRLRGMMEETGLGIIWTRRRSVYREYGAGTGWTGTCDLGRQALHESQP